MAESWLNIDTGSQGTSITVEIPVIENQDELLRDLADALVLVENNTPDTTALVNALGGVYSSASWLGTAFNETSAALTDGARSVSLRVGEMLNSFFATVEDVMDVDLDNERDLSLELAYEMDTGAVSECTNTGSVSADTNVGGIVGTVGFEVAFDLEDELKLSDYLFSEAEHQIFSVIRVCGSDAEVTAGKDCAGGIVGSLGCGAVVDSLAVGTIAAKESYAGGVAGSAAGAVASTDARVSVSGGMYVGGIAGEGAIITDCRACAWIASADEYAGCIAGWTTGELTGNTFVDTGASGVDGVAYAGRADAVTYRAMLSGEDVPAAFGVCRVTFVVEDETVSVVETDFGGSVDEIPEVPNRDGAYWVWDDFDRDHVYADITVTGAYAGAAGTLSDGGTPARFIVEGSFYPDQTLTCEPFDVRTVYDGAGEGWTLTVNDYDEPLTVRMRTEAPDRVCVVTDRGQSEIEFTVDGSYIVFELPNGGTFYITGAESGEGVTPGVGTAAVAGAVAVGAGGGAIASSRRRRRRETDEDEPDVHE